MNYEEFKEQFIIGMQEQLEEQGILIQAGTTLKNNGQHLDSITFQQKNNNVSPILYVESYFQDYLEGKSFDACIEDAKDLALKHLDVACDIKNISPEFVKNNIYATVINAAANREMLSNIPHRIVEDLAVVPTLSVKMSNGDSGTIRINNQFLSTLKMTKEELLQQAISNTEKQHFGCKRMDELLFGFIKDDIYPEASNEILEEVLQKEIPPSMYVVLSEEHQNGAAVLACKNALAQAVEKVGEDVFVLPSSIFEVILIPKSQVSDVKDLQEMVKEVNRTELSPGEVLSDNVYHYSLQNKKLTIATDEKVEEIIPTPKAMRQHL